MKWVRYWLKVSGSSFIEETYNAYPDQFSDSDLKDLCEDWVDRQLFQQSHDHIKYDFEVVEIPPKKWLLDNINSNTTKIEILKKKNESYESIIEENYRLNDKIEKIKNNIDEVD